MKVDDFYNYTEAQPPGTVAFTREASSAFAKEMAGDFNPIHNPDARRFCVPGDLLFAVVLNLFKARAKMNFEFEQMVDASVTLEVPVHEHGLQMVDDTGKCYLDVSFSGDVVDSDSANRSLIAAYVKFSGQTFPYLLIDLMKKHGVMINAQRPLIFYRTMSIELQDTQCDEFDLAFTESTLKVDGKKGEVDLHFDIVSGNKVAGTGCKHMLVGGLREYQQDEIDDLITEYNSIKAQYQAKHH